MTKPTDQIQAGEISVANSFDNKKSKTSTANLKTTAEKIQARALQQFRIFQADGALVTIGSSRQQPGKNKNILITDAAATKSIERGFIHLGGVQAIASSNNDKHPELRQKHALATKASVQSFVEHVAADDAKIIDIYALEPGQKTNAQQIDTSINDALKKAGQASFNAAEPSKISFDASDAKQVATSFASSLVTNIDGEVEIHLNNISNCMAIKINIFSLNVTPLLDATKVNLANFDSDINKPCLESLGSLQAYGYNENMPEFSANSLHITANYQQIGGDIIILLSEGIYSALQLNSGFNIFDNAMNKGLPHYRGRNFGLNATDLQTTLLAILKYPNTYHSPLDIIRALNDFAASNVIKLHSSQAPSSDLNFIGQNCSISALIIPDHRVELVRAYLKSVEFGEANEASRTISNSLLKRITDELDDDIFDMVCNILAHEQTFADSSAENGIAYTTPTKPHYTQEQIAWLRFERERYLATNVRGQNMKELLNLVASICLDIDKHNSQPDDNTATWKKWVHKFKQKLPSVFRADATIAARYDMHSETLRLARNYQMNPNTANREKCEQQLHKYRATDQLSQVAYNLGLFICAVTLVCAFSAMAMFDINATHLSASVISASCGFYLYKNKPHNVVALALQTLIQPETGTDELDHKHTTESQQGELTSTTIHTTPAIR